MRLVPDIRAAAPMLALVCAGAPAWAAAPTVVLHAHAEVALPQVRLGDVADLEGLAADGRARAAAVVVAQAPRPGQAMLLDRARVLARLPVGWRARGVAATTVTRAVQQVDAVSLCEAELAALQPRLDEMPVAVSRSAQCEVDAPTSLLVAAGASTPKADVSSVRLVDGPQRTSIALAGADGGTQAITLTLRLSLVAQRWCAREPIAQSAELSPERFVECRVPVRHERELDVAGAPLPPGRLRRALHADEALRMDDAVLAGDALAGDAVTVRARNGGFAIEAGGHLLQDARVGDAVRVRIGSADAPVVGRLAGPRLVELENQP